MGVILYSSSTSLSMVRVTRPKICLFMSLFYFAAIIKKDYPLQVDGGLKLKPLLIKSSLVSFAYTFCILYFANNLNWIINRCSPLFMEYKELFPKKKERFHFILVVVNEWTNKSFN